MQAFQGIAASPSKLRSVASSCAAPAAGLALLLLVGGCARATSNVEQLLVTGSLTASAQRAVQTEPARLPRDATAIAIISCRGNAFAHEDTVRRCLADKAASLGGTHYTASLHASTRRWYVPPSAVVYNARNPAWSPAHSVSAGAAVPAPATIAAPLAPAAMPAPIGYVAGPATTAASTAQVSYTPGYWAQRTRYFGVATVYRAVPAASRPERAGSASPGQEPSPPPTALRLHVGENERRLQCLELCVGAGSPTCKDYCMARTQPAASARRPR